MNPLARERRSRDTRPQPAWRHPATPCKAAQPPPPPRRIHHSALRKASSPESTPTMKRPLLLLPLVGAPK